MIFNKTLYRLLFVLLFSGLAINGSGQLKVGDIFSGWHDGVMDIHHINAGKGECAFYILPDGTTMLVDAGATGRPKPRVTDPRPDGSRTPGEWITRYILHFMDEADKNKLDYILLTHFHDDHMGTFSENLKKSPSGDYILSGITEVGDKIPFGKIVDRGWPEYDFPAPLKAEYIHNYIGFVKHKISNDDVTAEQFIVGSKDQFKLNYAPGKYPGFEIRNIAANGHVWTGFGNNSRNHFPLMEDLQSSQYPDENKTSIAFRLSYGKFDYFNGGDITSGPQGTWEDIETPVGLVTGPVDVCLANHHAYYDAMGEQFLQAVRPRVFIIQSWSPSHPSPGVLARMMSGRTYPGPRDVFQTNVMEEIHTVIGTNIDNMKSRQGHIVIRVEPGGESYMIYILDDSQENYKITGVHGPYQCN